MREKKNQYRSVMLGLAVGDAMGHTVDNRTLAEICNDYGPNGLLGYDLVNGYADVTSYTQLAAFTANGLLLGLTRGQLKDRFSTLLRCITLSLKEWGRSQTFSLPEKNYCWLSGVPEMKRKFCMDTRILDALSKEPLGCVAAPQYKSDHPGALTMVVPISLMGEDSGLNQRELNQLGAEAVALTHGETDTILAGAALTHLLCALLAEPSALFAEQVQQTMDAIALQFGGESGKLYSLLQQALILSVTPDVGPMEAMETLGCRTAAEALAGAVYAVATCGRDFDAAMITAVNHSGRSAAVGALTGSLLGAILENDALPDFYLESLEPTGTLTELADDMTLGFSNMVGRSLFDMDWDRKYLSIGG
ncbi:MAG: hypothetical protein E7462_02000 [Ruminococcaceae bacterium]|nr:hypothetical protein [Oscillospiraceae bacterium]